ncbi:hypothetical protein AVO43_04595 [Microbulbifer sp. ZGT114]|nr:hypothetical protein AVO43_04595 [Microbulbifer sp. ZGT114]
MIVKKLASKFGVSVDVVAAQGSQNKLLSVGSILHEAINGDEVWGSGINGKCWARNLESQKEIEVHSVRGPVTRKAMLQYGFEVPESYGDPGLLFSFLYDNEISKKALLLDAFYEKHGLARPKVVFIPNINDERFYFPEREVLPEDWLYLSPTLDPVEIAAHIRLSQRVVSSSLHGLVFADAEGKPATLFKSRFETILKYEDYFEGTDRSCPAVIETVGQAIDQVNVPEFKGSVEALIQSFPLSGEVDLSSKKYITKHPVIEIGRQYNLADCDDYSEILKGGWSKVWNGSSWSTEKRARIAFSLAERVKEKKSLTFSLLAGTLHKGHGNYEKIRVSSNGRIVSTAVLKRGDEAQWVKVPLELSDGNGEFELTFSFENPSAPDEYLGNGDKRLLGAWISSVQIEG